MVEQLVLLQYQCGGIACGLDSFGTIVAQYFPLNLLLQCTTTTTTTTNTTTSIRYTGMTGNITVALKQM